MRTVREFYYALAQALHDVDLEQGGATLEHYWDSDSVHLPVRGMLDFSSGLAVNDLDTVRRQRLVQALFGAGYLGQVKLLPPHRAEFLSAISRWMRERPDVTSATSAIVLALETPSARSLVSILERTRRTTVSGVDAVQQTLNELATLDSEAFVLVESAWGTWPERLRSLLDSGSLNLDEPGEFIADDDVDLLNDFASLIQRVRGGERTIATAVDAAAFVALSKKVEAARRGESNVYPRFFTSSPQLRNLWRGAESAQLQRALRIEVPSARSGVPASDYIWRGANYYYLRASNRALRIESHLSSSDISTLGDLRALRDELGHALAAGSGSVEDLLEHYPLAGDANLSSAVDNFSSFRMVDIWLGYRGRRDLEGVLDNLQSLSQFGATPLVASTMKALEGQNLKQLREEIREREISLRMLDAVYSTSSAHERIKGRGALSLNEDLGAVRWGLEYVGSNDSVTLQPASSGEYTDIIGLYDVEKLKRDDTSAERAVVVLLGLEEFELARRLIDIIGTRTRSEVLTLMSFVASIARPGYQSELDLSTQLGLLRNWWQGLLESVRAQLVLGYGYALFKLWEYSARDGEWPGVGNPYNSVAAESLNVVKSYLLRSIHGEWGPVSDLRLAYAVNHVVYVAFSADLVDDPILEYAGELERVAERMDNHRFLDTVGVALLWRAKHVLGADPIAANLRDSLAERALRNLDRAANLVSSDVDVRRHRDDAASYLLRLRENG